MIHVFHSADSRGFANNGWLQANHSFSFASWFNRNRMHFGALRVLNDDVIAPGMGFGQHPHDNMEIITIPLTGSLKHEDSMGFSEVIHAGEVQVMSAGTGIYHSEFNASATEEINLFQLWIFPNKKDVTPRYQQLSYSPSDMKDSFLPLVTPDATDEGLWIHQQAWIHMIDMSANCRRTYQLKQANNGVYCMNIEGKKIIEQQPLTFRDALGISETDQFEILAEEPGRLLLIEVPMNF
ncbi:MAG: pirin family protein [Flavobacteriales bacterium]